MSEMLRQVVEYLRAYDNISAKRFRRYCLTLRSAVAYADVHTHTHTHPRKWMCFKRIVIYIIQKVRSEDERVRFMRRASRGCLVELEQ